MKRTLDSFAARVERYRAPGSRVQKYYSFRHKHRPGSFLLAMPFCNFHHAHVALIIGAGISVAAGFCPVGMFRFNPKSTAKRLLNQRTATPSGK